MVLCQWKHIVFLDRQYISVSANNISDGWILSVCTSVWVITFLFSCCSNVLSQTSARLLKDSKII